MNPMQREEFERELHADSLRKSRILVFAGIPVLLLMTFQDVLILNTTLFLPWRISVFIPLFILLCLIITPLRSNPYLLKIFHILALCAVMIGVCGIVVIAYGNKDFDNIFVVGTTFGLITAVFCIHLTAGGVRRYVPLIIVPPFLILFLCISVFIRPSLFLLSFLANPLIIILGTIFVSRQQEKIIAREFLSRINLKTQKQDLEREVSFRHSLESLLTERRNLDETTGLYHRRAGIKILQEIILLSDITGKPIAAALIDINDMKQYNDRFGYAEGDTLLKNYASLLKRHFFISSYLIRYEGDAVLIILLDGSIEELKTTLVRAEKDLEKLGRERLGLPVTISAGFAFRKPGTSAQVNEFLKKAEESLSINKTRWKKPKLSPDIRLLQN